MASFLKEPLAPCYGQVLPSLCRSIMEPFTARTLVAFLQRIHLSIVKAIVASFLARNPWPHAMDKSCPQFPKASWPHSLKENWSHLSKENKHLSIVKAIVVPFLKEVLAPCHGQILPSLFRSIMATFPERTLVAFPQRIHVSIVKAIMVSFLTKNPWPHAMDKSCPHFSKAS